MDDYSEERINLILSKVISRLTTIGINPKIINNLIIEEGIKWGVIHPDIEAYSPVEKLVISHNVFEKKALERADNLLKRIKRNLHDPQKLEKLIAEFETLGTEIYFFNKEEILTPYTVDFEEPWKKYEELRAIIKKPQLEYQA